ncbi:GAF domain-containing protein [Candidatus Magnetaquicoccus inordinatus]|uniref:GAF domain-containing protein n=1 Tax=Candidatus Magnetaquicoccus inordinatus TaxID=2496818 RepID=UPI00102D292F|nr:GAF domain-containing protein [Candidatus Magnetaquicoccus inordinatus]
MKKELANEWQKIKSKQEALTSKWKSTGNQDLLQFFMEILPKVIDADRCSFFIHDPVTDAVWLQCGTGLKERSIVIPKSGSNVGKVVATGKPVCIVRREQQSEFAKQVEEKVGYMTQNMMCVPIMSQTSNQVTGAIQVINKQGENGHLGFTEADLALLERVANHVGMVTENIYLSQEMVTVSDKLRGTVDMAEWVIKMWMGFMGLVILAAFGVIVHFTPHMLEILKR